MAYDSTTFVAKPSLFAAARAQYSSFPVRSDDDFHRAERIVVVAGASLLGALIGAASAIVSGQIAPWMMLVWGAPVYVLALYFAVATLHDGLERNALGCAIAATMHVAALFAWPLVALVHPTMSLPFWYAPAIAFSALIMFASCWGGHKRVVYRACCQGALTAACASYLGLLTAMGS